MGEMTREEIDARFASMRAEMQAGFAELRSEMQKQSAEIIKWVVGMIVGAGAVAITVMTFVLNNAVPKTPFVSTAPVPVVITNLPPQPPPAPR
jgi:hypothetical protein